jgi:hypothetical protein
MALIELTCPNCSASLPPREESGQYQCEYCATRFRPARPDEVAGSHVRVSASRRNSGVNKAALISVIVALLGVGAATAATIVAQAEVQESVAALPVPTPAPTHPQPGAQVAGTDSPAPAPVAAKERVTWDDVGGMPVPVTIGEREAVIGRVRARPEDLLHVNAYDARTLAPIYKVGPLGTYGDAYRNTYFVAKGGALVVSNYRNALQIHELETGAQRHELTLSDRVEYICDTGQADQVWVAIADERHILVDLKSGESKEAKRPAGCAKSHWDAERKRERGSTRGAPRVEGFKVTRVLTDGDLGVAAGVKSPGTGYPRIVGFDPKTKAVRWEEELFSVDPHAVDERSNEFDDLVNGVYYGTYGTGADRWHLAAFDAQSGKSLWDTEMSDIFAVDSLDGVVATEASVYVVRTSSLDIYDSKTGALSGAIGSDTYE